MGCLSGSALTFGGRHALSRVEEIYVSILSSMEVYKMGFGSTGAMVTAPLDDLKCIEMQIKWADSMSPGKFSHGKNRPDCSGKDVRHFEFEPQSSIIEYEVGDVLEILPGQSPAAIDAFIQRCGLNPEAFITVCSKSTETQLRDSKVPIKLRSFVELTMDVASASPRRYFFEIKTAVFDWTYDE
ncbi:hypothetical protein U1Q18_043973 [Sarracenia purpurea var. burkii]